METVRELKGICRKNDKEIFYIHKYIHRRMSIYITRFFLVFRTSANAVTFLSLIYALAGCYFLTMYSKYALAAAALFIFLYEVLDVVDGELARYYLHKKMVVASLAGEYFDFLVHFFSTNLMYFFMGVGIYNQYGFEWAILLGFVCCIGLSNFPNFCCGFIILQALYKNNNREGKAGLNRRLLGELKEISNVEAPSVINEGTRREKAFALVKELLIFPGCLLFLPLACIGDIVFAHIQITGVFFSFRLIYLILFSIMITANTVRKSIICIKRMSSIKNL